MIERHPALRRVKIEQLRARSHEQLVKVVALQEMHKKRSEFLFLPAGIHFIAPREGRMSVLVNEQTAIELEAQRRLILGKGNLPFFDFEHEGGRASFYPTDFFWREGEGGGVFVRGIWSKEGERAWKSGEFKAFSPCFIVDKTVKPPYPVVCLITAGAAMGGLTNAPVFGEKLRLRVNDSP